MGRITQDMLLKHASHTKRRTNETENQYLKRLTHIYFQEKNIEEIDNLSLCRSLSVLYLYDNQISVIKNLNFASNLTHLYLQKNRISQLSGLKYLQRLTKLYLGHNSITVVEGLSDNHCLTELHIEYQKLPLGEKLLFEPRSLAAISKSLSVLNLAGNNIDEIGDLKVLRKLNHLMIANNKLHDWVDLSETFLEWRFLFKLDISGNPLCKDKKWKDKFIIISKSLVMIDNREVTESTRQFVQNWYAKKEAKGQSKKVSSKASILNSKPFTSERDSDRLVIPHNYINSTMAFHPKSPYLPPVEHEHQGLQNHIAGQDELPPIMNVTNDSAPASY